MKLKTVLTGSVAASALMLASTANAGNYYVSIFGGMTSTDDSFSMRNTTSGSSFTASGPGTGSFLGTGSHDFGSGSEYALIFSVTGGWSEHNWSGITSWGEGFESGYVIGAAIGWDFDSKWRSDFEIALRHNDVDDGAKLTIDGYHTSNQVTYSGTIWKTGTHYSAAYDSVITTNIIGSSSTIDPSADIKSQGEITTWSYMANLWYDFDWGSSRFHPFVGAGIGLAQVDLEYAADAYTIHGLVHGTSVDYSFDADDWGWAYQVGAGIAFDFGDGIQLSAQYRYFATSEVQAGPPGDSSINVQTQNFIVGLHLPFGG